MFETCTLSRRDGVYLLLLGLLSLLENRALRVGNAGNAGEGEVLEVLAVGGELGASDRVGALVVEAEGGASNSLDGGVGLSLTEGNDGTLLGSTTDLNSDSAGVSESRNLVAGNVQHIVGLSGEGDSNGGAGSTGEAVVLTGDLPDEVSSSQRQSRFLRDRHLCVYGSRWLIGCI